MTSYTPAHEAGDLAGITIDFLVEGGIQVLNFIGILVVLAILGWMATHLKKARVMR